MSADPVQHGGQVIERFALWRWRALDHDDFQAKIARGEQLVQRVAELLHADAAGGRDGAPRRLAEDGLELSVAHLVADAREHTAQEGARPRRDEVRLDDAVAGVGPREEQLRRARPVAEVRRRGDGAAVEL